MVTLYTKPNCVQCTATKRRLDTLEIEYEMVDVVEDEAAFALIKGLGFQQAPVVNAGDDWWSGFRPDKIDELKSVD